MESVVVLLSGGIGSAVAAFRHREATRIHPLYVNYGRPSADHERTAAADLAVALEAKLIVVDLPHVAQIARVQAARLESPAKQQRLELGGPDDVPGLAATLLAVGTEFAATVGAQTLVTGRNASTRGAAAETLSQERTVDPREFHHAAAAMIEAALPSVRPVRLEAPFLDMELTEVVQLGLRFDVPFEQTWSCHRTGAPCGTCSACTARAAAFVAAGLPDPLAGNAAVRQAAAHTG